MRSSYVAVARDQALGQDVCFFFLPFPDFGTLDKSSELCALVSSLPYKMERITVPGSQSCWELCYFPKNNWGLQQQKLESRSPGRVPACLFQQLVALGLPQVAASPPHLPILTGPFPHVFLLRVSSEDPCPWI
jgi:hypothetical protein